MDERQRKSEKENWTKERKWKKRKNNEFDGGDKIKKREEKNWRILGR